MTSLQRYSDRRVLITGGGSGIGQATVLRILAEGGRVVAADISESGLKDTVARAEPYPSASGLYSAVPYWSMPENTDHPTQKPEKLLAKIILASSREGDLVFDPFNGSGTTTVVAKKLGRHYLGVEIDETYCCLAQKRLETGVDGSKYSGICRWSLLGEKCEEVLTQRRKGAKLNAKSILLCVFAYLCAFA